MQHLQRLFWLSFMAILVLQACDEKSSSTKVELKTVENDNSDRVLPSAQGAESTITVVVQNARENDPHIEALKDALGKTYPMTQFDPEPYFSFRYLEAKNFGDITQRDRYIILLANSYKDGKVTKLAEGIFSTKAMANIRTQEDKFFVTGHNIWANGQEVMYLAAEDVYVLADKIKANADNLLNHFYQLEFKRIQHNLLRTNEQKSLEERIFRKHQVRIRVPDGYNPAATGIPKDSIAQNAGVGGFEWLAFDGRESFLSITLCYEDYVSESQLSVDSVVAKRNAIGRFMPCGDPNSYVGTEMEEAGVAPFQEVIELNGHYAVETHGWWDGVNTFMGGPFVNYAVIDEKRNRVVYIDGFVFAKGEPKRKFLMRLKTIMQTLQFE